MNKFDELLKLSDQIVDGYIDLLINPVYEIDDVMYSDKVQNILDIVIEKYKLIHSIDKEDINFNIDKLNGLSNDEKIECVIRIKNKLVDYKAVLNGFGITSSILGLSNLSYNMEFSLYDAILSIINIDVIKLLKEKIYSLNSDCLSDDRFIELLKRRLRVSKIELLFNTGLSEFIALNYDAKIDNIPRIDMNIIKKEIKNDMCGDLIQNTVVIFLANNIKQLSKIRYVKNNDKEVFKYLVTITQIEVLLNYLEKNKLNELYDFCKKMTNKENVASMNNVKRLVKRKMMD